MLPSAFDRIEELPLTADVVSAAPRMATEQQVAEMVAELERLGTHP